MRRSWNAFPKTALSRPCRLGNGGGTQSDGTGGRGMRGRRDTGLVYVKTRFSTREHRAKPGSVTRGFAPNGEAKGRFMRWSLAILATALAGCSSATNEL